jgi:hypothetical protein
MRNDVMTCTVKEQRSRINANAGSKGLAHRAQEKNTVGRLAIGFREYASQMGSGSEVRDA